MRERRVIIGDAVANSQKWYDTAAFWRIMPWAVIVTVILMVALLTIILTGSLRNTNLYLLWPWFRSFLVSLIWALLGQEVIVVLFLTCAQRRANARTARAAEQQALPSLEWLHQPSPADPPRESPRCERSDSNTAPYNSPRGERSDSNMSAGSPLAELNRKISDQI